MSKQIFRKVALERLSSPEQLDQTVRVTSSAGWLVLASLMLLVIAGLFWGVIGKVPEKVEGKGILINPGGVLDVIASTHGRIIRFGVRTGEWVAQGQIVAEVAQPDIENDLEVAKARLAEAESQHRKVLDFQKRDASVQKEYESQKRQALNQQMRFAQSRLQWLKEREELESQLQAKGLITSQRVVNTKIEINNAKEEFERALNDVKHLDIEESSLGIAKERERLEQESKIAGLRRDVDILSDKLRRNTQVITPYSGFIMEFKVNPGEVVEPGRALFSMLPEDRSGIEFVQTVLPEEEDGSGQASGPQALHRTNDLQAKLYVRPEDGKKIKPGMEAKIAPSTIKREEYGFIVGKVVDVAAIPSTEEGIMRVLKNRQLVQELSGGGAPFEVTVELVLDPKSNNGYKWSSSAGPVTEINPGTLTEGIIIVRNIRLFSLLVPAFERLFGAGPQ